MKSRLIANALTLTLLVANAAMAYTVVTMRRAAPRPPDIGSFFVVLDKAFARDRLLRPDEPEATLVTFARQTAAEEWAQIRDAVYPYLSRGLRWYVVTPEPSGMGFNVDSGSVRPFVFALGDRPLRVVFGQTASWQRWFLFDSDRQLRQRGSLSTVGLGGLSGFLGTLLERDDSYSRDVVRKALLEAVEDDGFARERRLAVTSVAQQHLVLLLNDAAATCPSLPTLKTLNDLAQTTDNSISVLVPDDWSASELESVRTTLNLTVPVSRADPSVMLAWRRLQTKFGVEIANGILASITASGIQDVIVGAKETFGFVQRIPK